MKHFSEISLIATVSFIGELLHYLIPLPVPSSIYGLLLMLLLLVTHIVKLDHVKTTADWLIGLMPVMFVGPTVGLITSYDSYKDILIPIVVLRPTWQRSRNPRRPGCRLPPWRDHLPTWRRTSSQWAG